MNKPASRVSYPEKSAVHSRFYPARSHSSIIGFLHTKFEKLVHTIEIASRCSLPVVPNECFWARLLPSLRLLFVSPNERL